jgi:hypothetical protein
MAGITQPSGASTTARHSANETSAATSKKS